MNKTKLKKLYNDFDEFLGNHIEDIEELYKDEYKTYANDVNLLEYVTLGTLYNNLIKEIQQ